MRSAAHRAGPWHQTLTYADSARLSMLTASVVSEGITAALLASSKVSWGWEGSIHNQYGDGIEDVDGTIGQRYMASLAPPSEWLG